MSRSSSIRLQPCSLSPFPFYRLITAIYSASPHIDLATSFIFSLRRSTPHPLSFISLEVSLRRTSVLAYLSHVFVAPFSKTFCTLLRDGIDSRVPAPLPLSYRLFCGLHVAFLWFFLFERCSLSRPPSINPLPHHHCTDPRLHYKTRARPPLSSFSLFVFLYACATFGLPTRAFLALIV